MKSRLLSAITACAVTLVLSTNANAAFISADWQSVGDNLITRDTASGLDWLDLTVTDGMSYDQVITQLSPGGQFQGFRFATSAEVITLWNYFGIDLSVTAPLHMSGYDPSLSAVIGFLGSTFNTDPVNFPYGGIWGVTADADPWLNLHLILGAYYYLGADITYYDRDKRAYATDTFGYIHRGSYLVQVVPVPAAIWLFCSGLLCLAGVAKRRKIQG